MIDLLLQVPALAPYVGMMFASGTVTFALVEGLKLLWKRPRDKWRAEQLMHGNTADPATWDALYRYFIPLGVGGSARGGFGSPGGSW